MALGALALVLAGATQLPTGILRAGVPSDPAQNLEFLGANSFAFRLGMMLTGVSMTFFILGLIALYAYLSRTKAERLAFAGLVVTVGFLVLFLPVIGFAAYVVPAIGSLAEQGDVEMIRVMDQTFREPFIPIPFLGGIPWNIGSILLGIAIWRSERPGSVLLGSRSWQWVCRSSGGPWRDVDAGCWAGVVHYDRLGLRHAVSPSTWSGGIAAPNSRRLYRPCALPGYERWRLPSGPPASQPARRSRRSAPTTVPMVDRCRLWLTQAGQPAVDIRYQPRHRHAPWVISAAEPAWSTSGL